MKGGTQVASHGEVRILFYFKKQWGSLKNWIHEMGKKAKSKIHTKQKWHRFNLFFKIKNLKGRKQGQKSLSAEASPGPDWAAKPWDAADGSPLPWLCHCHIQVLCREDWHEFKTGWITYIWKKKTWRIVAFIKWRDNVLFRLFIITVPKLRAFWTNFYCSHRAAFSVKIKGYKQDKKKS